MSTDAANPYTPPAAAPPEVASYAGTNRLEYRQSIAFVFESPNWMMNVLWFALCSIAGAVVPLLPALVMLGYQFEIVEALLLTPGGRYPDFQFDRIVKYLVRGLYPFLVLLICGVVVLPIMLVAIGIPGGLMALLMAAVGEDAAPVVAIVMFPLIFCIAATCQVLLGTALIPFILRAGLIQDISPSFDFAFAKDFVRKMWREEILAFLFIMLAAIVAQIVGLLLLCVGVLFTVTFVQFAQAHLGMQLYRLYLLRGGEKIPLKPAEAKI